MPVPFKIGGGQGFYNGQSVSVPGLEDNYESFINEGRLKSQPLSYENFKPFTKQGASAAFQNFLSQVSPDLNQNAQTIEAYRNTLAGETEATPMAGALMQSIGMNKGEPSNVQMMQQLINGLTNKGLAFEDKTGSVELTPGGINLKSNRGWSAGINPLGGEVNIGPVGIQGTWAGDKSIQAKVNLQPERINPMMMSSFLTPEVEQEGPQYYGFGLQQRVPVGMQRSQGAVPLSAGRQLMEEQTENYMSMNPGYRY